MALFGAPIAHEDHAHRALRAALAIQERPRAAARGRRTGSTAPSSACASASIPAWSSWAPSAAIFAWTTRRWATPTNLAARLLNVAQPGQIVPASEHTCGLTEGFFVFDDLGEFTVKGKTAPVRA